MAESQQLAESLMQSPIISFTMQNFTIQSLLRFKFIQDAAHVHNRLRTLEISLFGSLSL